MCLRGIKGTDDELLTAAASLPPLGRGGLLFDENSPSVGKEVVDGAAPRNAPPLPAT